MGKTTVAVIFGGESSEYGVSLKSASAVIENLDRNKYNPVIIGITREGKWLKYPGSTENIKKDLWFRDPDCTELLISPGIGNEKFFEIAKGRILPLKVDIVFPVLHGTKGEDGSIQGLLEVMGMPYVGCNVAASAIGLDKDLSHKIVHYAGYDVPKSMSITQETMKGKIEDFTKTVGFPIYVKPAHGGSSIGMTKAENSLQLYQGITEAFTYDKKVVLEEMIHGFEVGCAVLGKGDLLLGTVDEIEVVGGFFDYNEKYTLKNSKIHLPARIHSDLVNKIKNTARGVYKALGCSGLARVDFFVDKENRIIFNEVNTLPGFTKGSRFPNMLMHEGYEYKFIIDKLIELGLTE